MKFAKRMILIMLSVTLLFAFASCKETSGGEGETKTENLFLQLDTLYRINLETANVVPVCPDPLCLHEDESCPFYQSSFISSDGAMVYYARNLKKDSASDSGFRYYLCSFDTAKGKYKELYQPEGRSITGVLSCGEYLFFVTCQESLDISGGYSTKYYIMRYEHKTGNVVCFTEDGLDVKPNLSVYENGRVAFSFLQTSNGTTISYTTDVNYENRIENDTIQNPKFVMDQYIFTLTQKPVIKPGEGISFEFHLTRTDSETGETIDVFEKLDYAPPVIYNGKILYGKKEAEPRLIGYEAVMQDSADGSEEIKTVRECYDRWGGKVYMCNSDGSGEQLLCDLSQQGYTLTPSVVEAGVIIGEKNGVGEYTVMQLWKICENGELNGKTLISFEKSALLIVNTVTGEAKVAEIEKRS